MNHHEADICSELRNVLWHTAQNPEKARIVGDFKDTLADALTERMEAKQESEGTSQNAWYRRTSAAIERETGITLSARSLETHAVGDNEPQGSTLVAYFNYFGDEFECQVRGTTPSNAEQELAELKAKLRELGASNGQIIPIRGKCT